jgi:hypothetical protein
MMGQTNGRTDTLPSSKAGFSICVWPRHHYQKQALQPAQKKKRKKKKKVPGKREGVLPLLIQCRGTDWAGLGSRGERKIWKSDHGKGKDELDSYSDRGTYYCCFNDIVAAEIL